MLQYRNTSAALTAVAVFSRAVVMSSRTSRSSDSLPDTTTVVDLATGFATAFDFGLRFAILLPRNGQSRIPARIARRGGASEVARVRPLAAVLTFRSFRLRLPRPRATIWVSWGQ